MLGRTAGEIRGKSIVWTARVFTGSPKIEEKSRKIRSPFLVPLAPLSLPSRHSSPTRAPTAYRTQRFHAYPLQTLAE